MEIHDHYFGFDRLQKRIGFAEWIVRVTHEHSALEIDYGKALALRRVTLIEAHPRHTVCVICRTQHLSGPPARIAIGGVEIVHDLPLVPDVIAGSQYMTTKVEEFIGNGRRQSKSARGIFRIGDYQIDLVGFYDVAQVIAYDLPSRTAENVADKKYLHVCVFDTTIWPESHVSPATVDLQRTAIAPNSPR